MGTPLIDIVEKELQSKAKELLPKITATVESLREARAKQLSEVIISKEVTPVSSVQSIVSAPKSEYVDLSLPIDLPGLNLPAKTLKTPGKPENKPKMKKELQKVKPKPVPGVKTSKEGSKIKTASSKELKPVVEKEKPKVYRIPKKPKVDTTETKESSTASASVNEEKPEPNASQDKSNPTDDSKPSRRSARLASQTDSNKTSSDNEHSEREVTPSTRKRRRTSGSKRAMILLSSDGSDISSDSYQSDSGGEEISSLQGTEESHKTTHHDMKGSSKKKSKLSKRVRESLSKSPPIVVTRYNRSVKPNRRYYNPNTEEEEDEPQISLEEVGPSYERDESPLHPLTLDVTRPCDDGNMEILGNAFLMEDEKVNVVHEMLKPKPKALKVKKNLLKGIRSRKKTKSRISFFQHR